jgi:hypothetical protein
MDATLYSLMELEVGFMALIAGGILRAKQHDGGYVFNSTSKRYLGDNKGVSGGFENAIGVALNHIRFVLYIEWRMIHELVKKNA